MVRENKDALAALKTMRRTNKELQLITNKIKKENDTKKLDDLLLQQGGILEAHEESRRRYQKATTRQYIRRQKAIRITPKTPRLRR